MHRDESGELRQVADAVFRALDRLEPDGHPGSLDLSTCDALTPETDTEHLTLLGKLCAQRLYNLGVGRADDDQDAVVYMTATLDMVVRTITGRRGADSEELRRLNEVWLRLQGLMMRLEQLRTGPDH